MTVYRLVETVREFLQDKLSDADLNYVVDLLDREVNDIESAAYWDGIAVGEQS